VKIGKSDDQPRKGPSFVDPLRLRSRCLEGLTRATDRYLRSRWFSGTMRLGFAALRGAHSLRTSTSALLLGRGHALDENPSGSGAARRT
jgi:hypothetical protein